MRRHALLLVSLLIAPCLTALAADPTVTLDGKPAAVSAVVANGKAFVDVVALMKLLGGQATYDPATNRITITAAAGGGAPGTSELPGDNGQPGKVYTLGQESPLYFRLLGAEFTAAQVVIGEGLYAPAANEKLLVLHFSVQNPQKTDLHVRGDSLTLMAVDQMNVNHTGIEDWGDAQNHARADLDLKPAQTLGAYTVIIVPAKGLVPKLIVQRANEDNAPVLRYDLRDKVTALQSPVADPADPTGATALEQVPAQANTAHPLQRLAVTIGKFEYVTTALDADAPAEGDRFLVATLLVHNVAPTDTHLRWDTIKPVLTDTDGAELKYEGMLAASANRSFEQDVAGGQEARVRIYFTVPKGATPKALALSEDTSRTYLVPVP